MAALRGGHPEKVHPRGDAEYRGGQLLCVLRASAWDSVLGQVRTSPVMTVGMNSS